MPKLSQKGNAFILLVIVFFLVLGAVAFVVYKTFITSTQKLAQNSDAMEVALKEEYQNPFEKSTQYENPFNEYHNPFEDIK